MICLSYKYHMLSLICGILKKGTNELTYKVEVESQKRNLQLLGDKGYGGGMYWENGIDIYTLPYKIDN